VTKHLLLAQALAKSRHRTVPQTVQYGELLSAAYRGLLNAAELFTWDKVNPKSTKPFECYARVRIAGQMNDYLRACNWGTRSLIPNVVSAEKPIGPERQGKQQTLSETFISKERSAVDQLNSGELFEKLIRPLPYREKRVFRLRFVHNLTMKEIAQCTGVSESRVSQILSQNMTYLRQVWSKRENELWLEAEQEH
jgi:RNA polymerase sigma factor (sigma-70 family)